MVGNILSAGLGLALSVLIARGFGQSALGVYASAVGWVLPLSLLVDAGIGTLITRDLAANASLDSRRMLSAAVRARLVAGLPVVFLTAVAAPFMTGSADSADGLRIASPLILILPLYSALSGVFRARGGLRLASALNIGMLLSQIAMTALAVLSGAGVLMALAANTLSSGLQLLVAVVLWRRRFREHGAFRSDVIHWRELIRRGVPFGASAVTATAQMRMAPALLERFSSSAEAGLYAAAFRLVEGARLIPQALLETLMPRLAERSLSDTGRRGLLLRSGVALAGFGVAAGLGALVLSEPVMRWIYGEDFAASAPILMILAWSLLPMSLKFLVGIDWIGRGRERKLGWISALVMTVQLLLMLLWVGQGGALAAALVVVMAEGLGLLLLWVLDDRRKRGG
jgi:O-antigen/teichoic acid export membrane protein